MFVGMVLRDAPDVATPALRCFSKLMTAPFIFEPACEVLGTKDAPDILNWLSNSLDSGAKLLLIDLHGVQMLESSGIGILMVACNRARRAGARLVLCSLSDDASLQIERSGLTEKFEIFLNREDFDRFSITYDA